MAHHRVCRDRDHDDVCRAHIVFPSNQYFPYVSAAHSHLAVALALTKARAPTRRHFRALSWNHVYVLVYSRRVACIFVLVYMDILLLSAVSGRNGGCSSGLVLQHPVVTLGAHKCMRMATHQAWECSESVEARAHLRSVLQTRRACRTKNGQFSDFILLYKVYIYYAR